MASQPVLIGALGGTIHQLKASGERHPHIEKDHIRPQREAQGMSLTDRAGFTDHGQLGMRLETFPQVGPSIGLIIDD